MITTIVLEERNASDELAIEAFLIQRLRAVLKDADYFRNYRRGSIFFDFDDNGQYKGSGFTVKD